jgi:hypothetical protein
MGDTLRVGSRDGLSSSHTRPALVPLGGVYGDDMTGAAFPDRRRREEVEVSAPFTGLWLVQHSPARRLLTPPQFECVQCDTSCRSREFTEEEGQRPTERLGAALATGRPPLERRRRGADEVAASRT